jgi:hypothetical protein
MPGVSRPEGFGEKVRFYLRGVPTRPAELKRSLQLLAALRGLGWHDGIRRRTPIVGGTRSQPWFTYPSIAWLEPRLLSSDRVFEFGSGNSTLWFAERVTEVVSVEHDPAWIKQLEPFLPSNVSLLFRPTHGEEHVSHSNGPSTYVSAIDAGGPFDVIVIDGVERNACALYAPEHLSSDGLILYDNSDRPGARKAVEELGRAGFGRVDFVGFPPSNGNLQCTSIFLRSTSSRWLDASSLPRFQGY